MNFYDSLIVALLRRIPPRFKGKRRFAKNLLAHLVSSRDVLVKDRFGFSYKVPSLSESIAFSLLVDGIYEPTSLNFMRSYLQPGDVFIDIGANIGAFTFPCASKIGSQGKVLAIEASPSILKYLKNNLEMNSMPQILLEGCAVSEKDSEEKIFYEAPSDRFGMGSFGKGSTEKQEHIQPTLVKCRTLDALLKVHSIEHVKAIKIDVEGYEAMVFKGANQLLSSSHAPLILFEFIDWAEENLNLEPGASQRQLLEYGYDLWLEKDFIRGKPPLTQPITQGAFNLIAFKASK